MDQYPFYSGHPSQQQNFALYGLPTPAQNNHGDEMQGSFDPLNYQPPFDASFNPAPQFGGSLPQSPPDSYTKHSVTSGEHPTGNNYPGSIESRDEFAVRSSSEEKEKEALGFGVTPAQSKRKAQNRAAQRAFRERKERHVRDLEEKVSSLQQESSTLLADNERLKREVARFSTENEILRATTHSSTPGPNANTDEHRKGKDHEPAQTGPMTYSPTDFYSDLVPAGQSARLHRVTYCSQTGERLLDAGATWDLIQGTESFKKGLVDIAGVTRRLKSSAQCDGQGPAFRECVVRQAIEESILEDSDELL
ncbi:hypothetical protein BDW74DRAFT_136050 [Aspergillus multicolor]|uniref:putative bZIP transcription factor (Fcr3) n=1 Tax=Aspergillus multicolor TaxID=41759 RepID=UPI003CCE177D